MILIIKYMKEDYKELVDFLGGKFEKIDEKLDKVDERFEKIDQRFDKIDEKFEKIGQRFDKIEEELKDKVSTEEFLDSQDKILTKLDALLQEKTIGANKKEEKQKFCKSIILP